MSIPSVEELKEVNEKDTESLSLPVLKASLFDDEEEISPEQRRAERAVVWRLDLFMLSIGFLSYCSKYLDQTNISNAYVSGMQEDLHLNGNQLNYFTTYFNIGYILMLYPSQIIISHIGPSKWLPSLELLWGALTCCLSLVKNYQQVYGIRALIGFCEGSAWPAWFTLISQWYHPSEISLRMAIYNIAQPTGAMMSGALQGALSTNLDGAGGRSGWQWAFIVNGSFTMAIALISFFILPGYPEKPSPLSGWWLKDEHVAICVARNRRIRRAAQRPITLKSFFETFKHWELWAFAIGWAFGGNTAASSYLNLYLKSLKNSAGKAKYTVGQLNYYPIIGQAIALVCELSFSWASDHWHTRLIPLLVHAAINITSNSILVAAPNNEALRLAGFYLNYVGSVSTMLLCAWAVDILGDKPEVRSVLFGSGTVIAYILSATIPIAAFPASQAPNWKIGAKPYLGFMVTVTFLYIFIYYQNRRDQRKKLQQAVLEGEAEVAEAVVPAVVKA